MRSLRIKGFVGFADQVRQEVTGPVSAARRAQLRRQAADALGQVHRILARHAARLEDLPSPTRRAYAYLARLDLNPAEPGAVQEPASSDRAPAGNVWLVGLKAYWDAVLHRLSEELVVSAQQKLELLGVTAAQIDELKRTGEVASHLVIHTPLDGTIVRKWAMEGKYVKTGDSLYQIADLTKVWLLLDLYEADLPWIAPFQEVSVMAQSLPGETFRGQIVFVDPVVDSATRTIKVRVNVDNPDRRLKPEMYVTARIDVAVGAVGHAATPAARQKVFGLGYSLLIFVYEKTDNEQTRTAKLNILHVIFVEKHRTGDFQTTTGIRQILANQGNMDDLLAFMSDRNLPMDDIQANKIAEQLLKKPPEEGYLTISNALQWRLQYGRVIEKAGNVEGVKRLR